MDNITFAFERGLGPWLIPLRGKIPVLDAWQSLPPVDEDTVRGWVEVGYNLGLRTGPLSGLVCIDDDQIKHGIKNGYVPPPTGLISESPTGGRHYWYVSPDPCPRNSASQLAPYVDVRGDGGQVVYPGSSHATLRLPYRWVETGQPGELPPETLAVLFDSPKRDTVRLDLTETPRVAASTAYADTALVREAARVRSAPEGTRNDTLNRAAFSLGQLVAGGELGEGRVVAELTSAAQLAGLGERETEKTIRSGLTGGSQSPRSVPATSEPSPARNGSTAQHSEPGVVLVPGAHVMPPEGEYLEQGTHRFAASALASMPGGAIYRRGGAIGELHDASFRAIGPDRMRSIVDEHVRLGQGKERREDDGWVVQYRTCSNDLARVVLAYAETQGKIRDLQHLATHPVCVGPEFAVASPGWNPESGVFLAEESVPPALDLETARSVLDDLVCDFPFSSASDRANYFGLLLTPILRPAINEPVPLHMIGSPVERSGKTKLAEIVLGCAVLGRPTPAVQLGVREEEVEKRLTATLLHGTGVIHLDNLRDFLDSPALASLLTSTTWQGRELGNSRMLSLPNGLTIVASGNNVHATGELSKRTVPIGLTPPTESPETRTDYRHPLLRSYVEGNRDRVLGALLGLVEVWRRAGRPMGSVGFGGFERWSAVVGGIMQACGYPEWLQNLASWRGNTDDFSSELREFVKAWTIKWGSARVSTSELFELAEELSLFSRQLSQSTDRGRRTAFGQKVLGSAQSRVVGEVMIELNGRGSHRTARLVDPC